MFTPRLMLACFLLACFSSFARGETPHWGKEIPEAALSVWDLTVFPDGTGLPEGSGIPEKGYLLYSQKCESCHGPKGQGRSAEELAGGVGSLTSESPAKTVGSYWPTAPGVFEYIRRAMPMDAPLSLTSDEVYAITAYLLYLSKVIGPEDEMNKTTLPGVVMPNRDGFVWIDAD